ncbi:type II secretion system protein [Persephonella atlantica]|uniref:Type II secretion system protein n=1 Tax=Persephonella atlantica TaxID=2699429 RepID=A0ABS1GH77_9AQUI|nr:type II secretion system protein [Persephonella atlantica]MBK3332298.1 type II secretion system protein [Persephonella atlantica]
MNSNRGFTLLEVVIAVVILSLSLTVILQVYANYLRDFKTEVEEIEKLQKVKRFLYKIPETGKSIPKVETKTKETKFGIQKEIYLIDGNEILFRYKF